MATATQKAPDGTEYEYDPSDPVDVMRVAAICEPSYYAKKKAAQAAFEAAAPEAAKQAATSVALGAGGPSLGDIQAMIAAAVKQALAPAAVLGAGSTPAAPVVPPLGAATTPVAGATTPVEGSGGNA